MDGNPEFVEKSDYRDAIWFQSACNLSALVKSLDRVTTKLWREAITTGKSTDWVNNHPIVRLYVEQLQHLCKTDYRKAYTACSDIAEVN